MNANAIYSKSGKGVQEASGKTSHLSRPDRAVLSAIDGRATLADVAQKVGKTFDPAFTKLIETLDKGGFIREVSAGTAGAGAKPAAAAAKPAAKSGPVDPASDLDFTTIMSTPGKATPPPQAPPKAAPPPSRQTATIPPPPPPPSADEKAKAERIAREQQEAFVKAREEAERKAQAERDRVKAEAEAKMRAELEAKAKSEAEARAKAKAESDARAAAEAEAKVKAAREAAVKAAAEAKARADAEAKKAREEAERARKEAEEVARKARDEAERARKEAEEKARREQEELRRKLEEERKAREEAERRAKEEAKRIEEERRKLEEERKAREEERRREEEERAARRKAEEEEEQERKRKKREAEEEEERQRAAERAERRKREEEEERQEAAEREARRKAKEKEKPQPKEAEPAPAAAKSGGGFSDTLLADLESFTTREEEEQKEREEALRKEKEAAAQRAREAEERRLKEEAERAEREEKERRKREAAEQKAREEAELREREEREKRRLEEEEEKRRKEAEEREKKAKQEEQIAARSTRHGAFDAEQRAKRERDLMARPARTARERTERKGGWGKPIAITLFLLIVIGLGVAHVIPIDVADYQTAASEALRRPVKIGSANLSLVTGLQIKFKDVSVGEAKFAQVRAHPAFDALTGPRKSFSLIELEGVKLDQQAVGETLFIKTKGDNFSVARIVARKLELAGPLALPKDLEGDLSFDAEGNLQRGFLRGPETLVAKFAPKGQAIEFDMSAGSFTVPFAPEITFSQFAMKGSATPQGMSITEWDGQTLNGTLSGTANVRWGDTWTVDGVVTARNIYAAVFAPALLSDGRGEGSGKFQMRGEPGKLAATSRIDGSFTINRGVLGSIDLSRAIQTQGRFATGRTQFNEMNGQATYDRGAVTLRNVTISAGQLNAGASAEIAQNGALSGRIVADVKVAQQQLRATLNLGGTLKDPQVKN